MARLPRYFLPNQPQHVIQRGNNRSPIFFADADYLFFKECLQQAAQRHGCAIHAYVFMTNHIHLLVTPETQSSLPRTIQSLGRRYVQYINWTNKRTGTLWEGRYRATLVDTDAYLMTCQRYIELNPVRAGMVTHPRDYRWSSYRHNGEQRPDELITEHENYVHLGRNSVTRAKRYRALFKTVLEDETLDTIRTSTNGGWVLGDNRFRAAIEVELN